MNPLQFDDIALHVPTILLPRADIDLSRWAVIACDQYTSEPAYWERVAELTAGVPSTLPLIFPEAYLEAGDMEQRVAEINRTMATYLEQGVLVPQAPGFVLLDRSTAQVPSRQGLMVALDLEQYDFRPGARSLIRATEGTIIERLPPRIRVRRQAPIELPHIMVLIDDPERTVIEPLRELPLEPAYDFALMQDGGHLRGWKVAQPQAIAQVVTALRALADPARFRARYGVADEPVMLYAMGDGNHSFATARAIWETLKAEAADPVAIMHHPARYALVELVNLHDPGLEFEAIHRVLFEVDAQDLFAQAAFYYAEAGTPCGTALFADAARAAAAAAEESANGNHALRFIAGGRHGVLTVEAPADTLAVATLQAFLDRYLQARPGARIDYIHGEETVTRLGSRSDAVGFYLPAISKHALFRTIVRDGALPRKTFSMGEADEKRFYLEARRITP